MKLVSHKPAHMEIAQLYGMVTVNGVKFFPGIDGKPTAHNVQEHEIAMFDGAEGFTIHHDDGSYSGPTDKKGNRIVAVSQGATPSLSVLNQAVAQATGTLTPDQAIAKLKSGNLSPEELIEIMKGAPVVQAAQVQQPVQSQPEGEQPPAQDEGEQPQSEREQGDEPFQPDMSDPESVAKLSRPEILGLARAFNVSGGGKNLEIAERIVEEFKKSDEYRAAHGLPPLEEDEGDKPAEGSQGEDVKPETPAPETDKPAES